MVELKRDGRLAEYQVHYLVTGAPRTSKNARNHIEPYKISVTWFYNFAGGIWHPTRVVVTGWASKGTEQLTFTNHDTFPDWIDLLLAKNTPNFDVTPVEAAS
jgi:hypothetical protein